MAPASNRESPRVSHVVGVSMLACLALSLIIHVVVFFGGVKLSVLTGKSGGGEQGRRGAGGPIVELTVAGADDARLPVGDEQRASPLPEVAPSAEPSTAPSASPSVAARTHARPEALAVPDTDSAPDPVVVPAMPSPSPSASSSPSPSPSPVPPHTAPDLSPARAALAAALAPLTELPPQRGSDSDVTSGGRSAGSGVARRLILGSAGLGASTVEAQRALLPEPVRCDDPVAGVWRAHKYDPLRGDWALFTLRVERGEGDALRGTITSRMWLGSPYDSSPPACTPDGMDYTVRMTARGDAQGQRIRFGASSYRVVRARCPTAFFGYNPDHFSGTVDPVIQEFQSVNNDGGRDRNAPYVFRRIACIEAPAAEQGAPTPSVPAVDDSVE